MKVILEAAAFLLAFGAAMSCLQAENATTKEEKPAMNKDQLEAAAHGSVATFAGGCFWCMQPPFDKLPGVIKTTVGYTGGSEANADYGRVSSGSTKHLEAVQVRFDPQQVSYEELLSTFWCSINPTQPDGQFADRGTQYQSAIFYHDAEQQRSAEASKKQLSSSGRFSEPIATAIRPAQAFYSAEEYHQKYYKKNPGHYQRYRAGSGRAGYLERVWGSCSLKTAAAESVREWRAGEAIDRTALKDKLSALQYSVTQKNGTERPFRNEYWDNTSKGIYVDIVSGEPLFSSTDKFKSGTGWPSFTKPLEPEFVVERVDGSYFMRRTEVRSKLGDSHLGHLFTDGPQPGGLRYCINSAALRFIPVSELEAEGYGRYLKLFGDE